MNHSSRTLQLAILGALANGGQHHKINLIGRPYQTGSLEASLNTTFDGEARQMADRAFETLKARGFVRPTYGDLANPELWVEITASGREALARGALDELDRVLLEIAPHLAEVRAGAWEAGHAGGADALRQAAHSARELIDQTLKEGAPDSKVKAETAFVSDPSSTTGVTRRHRMKFLMKKFRVESASTLKVAEEAYDLAIAVDDRPKAVSHARDVPAKQDVIDALSAAEIALRALLVK